MYKIFVERVQVGAQVESRNKIQNRAIKSNFWDVVQTFYVMGDTVPIMENLGSINLLPENQCHIYSRAVPPNDSI